MSLPVGTAPISRGFGDDHFGIDFKVPIGTMVEATGGGVVVRTDWHPEYGNVIVIDHGVNADGQHVYSLYGHLDDFKTQVGAVVEPGEVIGTSGDTGRSTGPHLHYEIIESPDPLPWNPTGSMGVPGDLDRVDPFTFDAWPSGSGGAVIPSDTPVFPDIGSIISPSILDGLKGLLPLFQQAEGSPGSPVILDLNGDGVVQTTREGSGTFFDVDANGFAESTGWVGQGDALLVWDRNGNGQIDSGRELFGNATLLADGTTAANGFQALAQLDANGDGVIDANDSAYANLKAWKDADGDGIVEASELVSLNDAGVASINVGYSDSSYVDPQGNTHRQVGSFSRTDGTSGTVTDVWFQRNLINTVAEEWLAVPADIATLPDLRGYGNVYDLHQAMVRDASGELKSLVQSFAAETNVQTRNALFEEILFKWTGAGPYWDTNDFRFPDGRRLEVLEKFFGETYVSPQFGYHQITPTGAAQLSQAYQGAFEMFYGQLMAQTHLKEEFDRITYTWDSATQSLKGDLTAVGAYLDSQLQADPEAAKTKVDEFVRSIHGLSVEAMLPFNTLHGGDRLTWLVGSDGMQRAEGTDGADILTASSNPFAVWAITSRPATSTGRLRSSTRFTAGRATM